MDINSMLAELRAERERLMEAILVLELLAAGGINAEADGRARCVILHVPARQEKPLEWLQIQP